MTPPTAMHMKSHCRVCLMTQNSVVTMTSNCLPAPRIVSAQLLVSRPGADRQHPQCKNRLVNASVDLCEGPGQYLRDDAGGRCTRAVLRRIRHEQWARTKQTLRCPTWAALMPVNASPSHSPALRYQRAMKHSTAMMHSPETVIRRSLRMSETC